MNLPAHWLKPPFLANKSSKRLQKSCNLVLMATVLFSATLNSGPASAGSMSGGASEMTQIMNNVSLMLQYVQQIQQYNTQLQQYQMQLRNMEQNPASALGSNTTQVIQGVGSVMSAQNSMGNTMAQISANFSQKYGSPIAGNYADQYRTWNNTNTETLGGALSTAGLHRDSYASDKDALQALFNQSQSSTGTVAAVQQLSSLNAMQIQQSQKLSNLVSSQNIAATTYMASQNGKQQAEEDRSEAVAGRLVEIPTGTTSSTSYTPLKLKAH